MKKFISKSLVLCLLIVSVLYLVSYIVDRGLRKSKRLEYDQWTDIYRSNIGADLVFSGSSRTRFMVSPKVIDSIANTNSYNLGITGWTFDMQYARLKTYLQHNKKPRYIVQNVDAGIFERREDLYDYEQFLPYLDDTVLFNSCKNRVGEFTIPEIYFPLFKYNNNLDLIQEGFNCFFNTGRQYQTAAYKGFIPNNSEWNGAFEEFKKQNPEGRDFNILPEGEKLFENFLDYCNDENIKVIFVFAPEYHEAQLLPKNRESEIEVKEELNDYATKYSAYFLDYTQDSICYDKKYFYDSQHLNAEGAQNFSEKLGHDIDEIMEEDTAS